MIEIFDIVFNSLANFVIPALPSGVGFWLHILGVSALIGGIVSGITAALIIVTIKFFAKTLLTIATRGLA